MKQKFPPFAKEGITPPFPKGRLGGIFTNSAFYPKLPAQSKRRDCSNIRVINTWTFKPPRANSLK
jgi:hypothetical protein